MIYFIEFLTLESRNTNYSQIINRKYLFNHITRLLLLLIKRKQSRKEESNSSKPFKLSSPYSISVSLILPNSDFIQIWHRFVFSGIQAGKSSHGYHKSPLSTPTFSSLSFHILLLAFDEFKTSSSQFISFSSQSKRDLQVLPLINDKSGPNQRTLTDYKFSPQNLISSIDTYPKHRRPAINHHKNYSNI